MAINVQLRVLGAFEISIDGVHVPEAAFERRPALALVKLLALNQRRLHREVVIDALWPDAMLDEASPRLHQAASYARKALGDKAAIVLRDNNVLLWPDAEVSVDLEAFELAADLAYSGSVEEAVAAAELYGGDLLPLDPYEDWVGERRDRLRLRFLEALRAARDWDILLQHEPADEEAHLALMRRFVGEGQRLATLRQFERLERALHEELGVTPSEEALAIRREVLDDVKESVDLVDRSVERTAMQPVLDEAQAGSGSLLLLSGVAGIGKTSLSEWLLSRAEQLGFVVGRGVGAGIDGLWPYAPVLEAVDEILRQRPALLEAMPETHREELMRVRGAPVRTHDRPDDAEGHQRLFVAVDELVRLASAECGLVLFVDDVHAADDASLAMLHYLARQANRSRLLVVVTVRTGVENSGVDLLRSLTGRRGAAELQLAALEHADAVELIQKVADGSLSGEVVNEIVDLAGGTPFYLEEMSRSAEGGGVLPDQLASIVSTSLQALPARLAEALSRVAVAGNRVDTDEFVVLSREEEGTAFALLDEALASQVLEHVAGGYQFRHGIVRQGLLDRLAPHQRRQVHRDAAQRFADMGAPPARVAHHLIAAEDYGPAGPWVLRAAQAAQAVGALTDARMLIEAVIEYSADQTRIELLALRADVLAGTGDPGAVPAYQLALQETEGPVRRLLLAKLARAALMGGAFEVAQAALEGLAPDGGPFDGPVLHAQGMLAYFSGDLDTAEALASEARQFALAEGAPAALLDVLTLQGMVAHNRGEWFDRMRFELTSTAGSKELAATIFDCHL